MHHLITPLLDCLHRSSFRAKAKASKVEGTEIQNTIGWAFYTNEVTGKSTPLPLHELNEAWALEKNKWVRTYEQQFNKNTSSQLIQVSAATQLELGL